MKICITCNNNFNTKERHLNCHICRSIKNTQNNKKERKCIECSKLYVGTRNLCSSCKFQKRKKKEKICNICNNLYIRPGKLCSKCHRNYYKDYYKIANRNNSGKRKKLLNQRTNKFSNLDIIFNFYKNCPENNEVDHIIPLKGKNVSGLHNEFNLQYLSKEENNFKRNKFDGTYNNEQWRDKWKK